MEKQGYTPWKIQYKKPEQNETQHRIFYHSKNETRFDQIKGTRMTKKVQCEICGKVIPAERLEILPDTTTCVKCSHTTPYTEMDALGPRIYEASEMEAIDMDDFEEDDM